MTTPPVLKFIRPMSDAEYETWVPTSIAEYAAEKVQAGNWPAEGALERSRKEHDELLPSGLHSPDHTFFSIINSEEKAVGVLWIKVRPAQATKTPDDRDAYIYNIEVNSDSQGKGLGVGAMRDLETYCLSLGIRSIRLHVFGHNETAQRLYRHLGYETTNINMLKQI